jgi:hypothetical protein
MICSLLSCRDPSSYLGVKRVRPVFSIPPTTLAPCLLRRTL